MGTSSFYPVPFLRRRGLMRSICCAFASLLLICFEAYAQSDQGTVAGTLSDPAGPAISKASIKAKNTQARTVFRVSGSATSATWNQFVPTLQQNYKDLQDVMNLVGADLEKGPKTLSIESIRAVQNADASLKKTMKTWKKFKETILPKVK